MRIRRAITDAERIIVLDFRHAVIRARPGEITITPRTLCVRCASNPGRGITRRQIHTPNGRAPTHNACNNRVYMTYRGLPHHAPQSGTHARAHTHTRTHAGTAHLFASSTTLRAGLFVHHHLLAVRRHNATDLIIRNNKIVRGAG